MARSDRLRAILLPVLDAMQTMPSFVYLIPALLLFGLGKVPAIFATVVYAVAPVIRLTDLGIRLVDREVVEASGAFGATPAQQLFGVTLPLALPTIMAGINQTTMMALSMVVVASMIGARGLGEEVLLGIPAAGCRTWGRGRVRDCPAGDCHGSYHPVLWQVLESWPKPLKLNCCNVHSA